MVKSYKLSKISDTHRWAKKTASEVKTLPFLILLSGPMGSGKTEWVRGFVREYLGQEVLVTSPSFSIFNFYEGKRRRVVHGDFFRLKSREDLDSTGFMDWLNQKVVMIIEWGDQFEIPWSPHIKILRIKFELDPKGERRISFL